MDELISRCVARIEIQEDDVGGRLTKKRFGQHACTKLVIGRDPAVVVLHGLRILRQHERGLPWQVNPWVPHKITFDFGGDFGGSVSARSVVLDDRGSLGT